MHFNNKYINLGDSEEEIRDKINYNFSQILSFAIGQEGYIGPKGATGIPGPSGKKGATGPTGDRATEWTRGNTFPSVLSTQEFDLWVDDSSGVGDVYESGPTANSWSYTGLSLYRSDYFDVYTGIVGPIGVTDKSSTGFKSTLSSNSTSLVFSDTILTSANINPNNSKLLISTEDQIDSPILSFIKSNGDTSISPGFRWKNTGSSSYLIFNSPGNLTLASLFDFSLSSFESGGGGTFIMNGSGNLTGNTQGDINLISTTDISLETNFGASPITISSLNFGVNTTEIYSNVLTEISNDIDNSLPYSLASLPTSGSPYNYLGGIRVNSNPTDNRVFDFTGMDGHSVLYGSPSGSVSSGNYSQVVFGETGGGTAGSTGAPYSYHVKRLNNISPVINSINAISYLQRDLLSPTQILLTHVAILNDVTVWNSNLIVASTTNSLSTDVYIWIPTPFGSLGDPLYYENGGNEYRVYLNEEVSSPTRKIKGIIFTYFRFVGNTGSLRNVFVDLPTPCTYVDLSFMTKGSNTNPNGRIFYKTCNGSGGFVSVTNFYSISSNAEPNPASSPTTA